jgi:hypothetical protein
MPVAQRRQEHIARGALGLEDRETVLLGELLDRRRNEGGPGAALRLVRPGDHPDHLRALGQQRLETRHREVGRAEENDAHQPCLTGSGRRDLMMPSPRCSFL